MAKAKCTKCGGKAEGDTYEEAASKINHAVGLSRGIHCGSTYGKTIDVTEKKPQTSEKPVESKPAESKPYTSKPEKQKSLKSLLSK